MDTDGSPRPQLDNEAGKDGEAGAGWRRNQEGVLEEDMWTLGSPLSAEERSFLEEFLLREDQLQVDIGQLQTLADHIDRTHRNLTKSHVAAQAVAVVSGALGILGLLLAPATAGGSLLLSAASKGLGTAAGVAGILTSIWGHLHRRAARAQAGGLVPGAAEAGHGGVPCVVAASRLASDYSSAVQDLRKNIQALRLAGARPRLVAAARKLQAGSRVSARRRRQVCRAFEGTPLTMSTHARWLGSVLAGFSLGLDVTSLRRHWAQLQAGAGAELAQALRAQAWELVRQQEERGRRREHLQQKLLRVRTRALSSATAGTPGTPPPVRPAQVEATEGERAAASRDEVVDLHLQGLP